MAQATKIIGFIIAVIIVIDIGFGLFFILQKSAHRDTPDGKGIISGLVRSPSNAPISGAGVSDGTRSAVTNVSGIYTLSGVPEGAYSITVQAADYQPSSETNVQVSAGKKTTVNFTLAPVPADEIPSSLVPPLINNFTDKIVIGSFASWSVYGRDYHVKDIKDSGSAEKLTHINYAFGVIGSDLKCAIADTWADYNQYYSASSSVDGKADLAGAGMLRGNFNQLRKLKAQYPYLKMIISIGGEAASNKFSATVNPANRKAFVSSCINMFIKGDLPPVNSGDPRVKASDIFDGIDIDWEFPNSNEDAQNYTALMAEFRSQLNALSSTTGKQYLLAIAGPAGDHKNFIEIGKIHQYLDFIGVMAYDIHGSWENATNFQSALYRADGNPDQTYSADQILSAWISEGAPADKLVMSVPFYGRGWKGVMDINNGLWQVATGPAQGTYEAGAEYYKTLIGLKGFKPFRNSQAQAFWIYNSDTGVFWTYDDPNILMAKMKYIKAKGLAGTLIWELAGDTSNGKLMTTIYNGLKK